MGLRDEAIAMLRSKKKWPDQARFAVDRLGYTFLGRRGAGGGGRLWQKRKAAMGQEQLAIGNCSCGSDACVAQGAAWFVVVRRKACTILVRRFPLSDVGSVTAWSCVTAIHGARAVCLVCLDTSAEGLRRSPASLQAVGETYQITPAPFGCALMH